MRWVLGHPRLNLALVTSAADSGKAVGRVYPPLAGSTAIEFSEPSVGAIADAASVAILAVPHTAAMAYVPDLLDAGLTVIDLSADFRLTDARVYERWYGVAHTAPSLLDEAVYGLPELDRTRLAGARLVACPGCYPTATILAAAPALESGIAVGSRVVVDAKSGVSGAGRAPGAGTHFVAVERVDGALQGGSASAHAGDGAGSVGAAGPRRRRHVHAAPGAHDPRAARDGVPGCRGRPHDGCGRDGVSRAATATSRSSTCAMPA